jgi:hypothetical protein
LHTLISVKKRGSNALFLKLVDVCGAYLADLGASEGSSHVHYNPFYDPLKHDGPLLPPAAALAPTLWPRFHLR